MKYEQTPMALWAALHPTRLLLDDIGLCWTAPKHSLMIFYATNVQYFNPMCFHKNLRPPGNEIKWIEPPLMKKLQAVCVWQITPPWFPFSAVRLYSFFSAQWDSLGLMITNSRIDRQTNTNIMTKRHKHTKFVQEIQNQNFNLLPLCTIAPWWVAAYPWGDSTFLKSA